MHKDEWKAYQSELAASNANDQNGIGMETKSKFSTEEYYQSNFKKKKKELEEAPKELQSYPRLQARTSLIRRLAIAFSKPRSLSEDSRLRNGQGAQGVEVTR